MTSLSTGLWVLVLGVVSLYLQGCGSGPPGVTVCAENEGDNCHCAGTVYYGIKFETGKPGEGATTTLESMTMGDRKSMYVTKASVRNVTCNDEFMTDPASGYTKWCYCKPAKSPEDALALATAVGTAQQTSRLWFIPKIANAEGWSIFGFGMVAGVVLASVVFMIRVRSHRVVADLRSEVRSRRIVSEVHYAEVSPEEGLIE